MRRTLFLLLAVSLSLMATEGDIRIRLSRRFPSCRGTLENIYTGDEFSFFDRFRITSGPWKMVLLLDKSRGEDWADIAAGGVHWNPDKGFLQSISAGWLRTDLGSGLVMAGPGSWSVTSELSLYKPPRIRNRIEPTSSAWSCRGEPLTGAGTQLHLGGVSLSLIAAVSWIDSTGEGYHRTLSEVRGRGAIRETLGGLRISKGCFGFTTAAAVEDGSDGYRWYRGGVDWNLEFPALQFTGETACGYDSSGVSLAFWTALSQDFSSFRHTLTLLRNPDNYPDDRTSPPIGRVTDTGLCYGMRWRIMPGAVLKAGTGAYLNDDDWLTLSSAQLEYRLPWSMEAKAGLRSRSDGIEVSTRSWLATTWKPLQDFRLSSKFQLTHWKSMDEDSSESGSGIELKIQYNPEEWLTIALGGTAFSTDGYNTRIYAGRSVLPGEFGSTALWDRGFLLHGQVSVQVDQNLFIRASFSRKIIDDALFLGSGWEETHGNSRTEISLQLDCSFPR